MAHIRKTVLGLKGLYISDILGTGLISEANWKQLALNLEGTFSLTQDDTEETAINVEESDNPIVQILKAGKKSFTTSIPDLAFEVAQELLGATKSTEVVEGVSVTRVHLPDDASYIYKMFKIVPKQGAEQFYYTKGQVAAKINGNLSKTETLNIDLTVTALTPDNDQTATSYDLKEGTNPAYALGNALADNALNTILGVTAGAMNITVDGGSAQTITNVSFASDTDWDDVVATLNSKTSNATWSFDVDEYRMKLTSNTVGSGSSISFAVSTGVDLLSDDYLKMANGDIVSGS